MFEIVTYITFEIREIETWEWHHCVSLVETTRNMYMMTTIGQFKLDLRSRSSHDPAGAGVIVMLHVKLRVLTRRAEQSGTSYKYLAPLYRDLLAINY